MDYREEILNALADVCKRAREEGYEEGYVTNFPTQEDAIDLLQKTGWLEEHDKILTESERKNGMNLAWECARKIAEREDDMRNCFHDVSPAEVFSKYSASEAMAKIKAYEEKQKQTQKRCSNCGHSYIDKDGDRLCDIGGRCGGIYAKWTPKQTDEIKVGDEVVDTVGFVSVVTNAKLQGSTNMVALLGNDFETVQIFPIDLLKKTGRHFPQIEEVLKQLKEIE